MHRTKRCDGFTMLELLVVVSIILVIAGVSAPMMIRTIAQMKLRSSAASVASILQQARMRAVRDDRFYTVISQAVGGSSGNVRMVCVDLNGNSSCDAAEPTIQLAGEVSFVPTGGPSTTVITCGSQGPSTCPSGYNPKLNYTPESGNILPAFEARGLPCVGNPATSTPVYPNRCYSVDQTTTKPVGFLYVMQYTGMVGTTYAAVAVTSAGRISVWSYEGKDSNGNDMWAQ